MDGRLSPHPRLALRPLLVALLALVAFAAATATARAEDSPATRWPVGGSTLRLAMGIATEHWGTSPCRGRVTVSWAGLGAGTNAQSSWANEIDPFTAPSRNTDCEIALSLQTTWDWPKLCTVVIHEVGHLTGHDHVDDPTDIMYFTYVDPAPECVDTPEPVETGPPVTAPPALPATTATAPRSAARATTRAGATEAAAAHRSTKAAKHRKAKRRRHG